MISITVERVTPVDLKGAAINISYYALQVYNWHTDGSYRCTIDESELADLEKLVTSSRTVPQIVWALFHNWSHRVNAGVWEYAVQSPYALELEVCGKTLGEIKLTMEELVKKSPPRRRKNRHDE